MKAGKDDLDEATNSTEMRRRTRQKVVGAAAVAVLLTGATIAAVSATGQSTVRRHHPATTARERDIATSASYLGITPAKLSHELRSGKSLAQVADSAGAGKSERGLIEALEAARKAKLAAATNRLPARVTAEVNRPGGPVGAATFRAIRLKALFSARLRLGEAAASYLGTSRAALQSELRSGKTLAQLADATAGKSTAGLIDALITAEKRAPAARGASAAQLARREQRLRRRATLLVRRKFGRTR